MDRRLDVPPDVLRTLAKNVYTIQELGPAERLSRKEIVRLCQETHGLLVTADDSVVPMLMCETDAPWGVVLLPDSAGARVLVLR